MMTGMTEHGKRRLEGGSDLEPIAKKQLLDPTLSSQPTATTFSNNRNLSSSSPPSRDDEVSLPNGIGGVNHEGGGGDGDSLELFRKEAMWRQMQDYKRQLNRAKDLNKRIDDEKRLLGARFGAIEIFWNTLVDEIRLLLSSSSNPPLSIEPNGHSEDPDPTTTTTSTSFLPSLSLPPSTQLAFEEALKSQSQSTKSLVTRLFQVGKEATSSSSNDTDRRGDEVGVLKERCRVLVGESITAKTALRHLRQEHESSLQELERARDELVRTEKKLDRWNCSTTGTTSSGLTTGSGLKKTPGMMGTGTTGTGKGGRDDTPGGGSTPGGAVGVGEGTVKSEALPTLPTPLPPSTTGASASTAAEDASHMLAELETTREISESRLQEVEELRTRKLELEQEVGVLRVKLVEIPDELIADSAPYRQLHAHLSYLKADSDRSRLDRDDAIRESTIVRERQTEFRENVLKEAANLVEDYQRRLTAKESDLTRVRGQREEFRSELGELKAKETDRMKHQEQVKILATSQKDRLAAYASEVKRLRLKIMADAGETELVESFSDEEIDTLKDLEQRLHRAEGLALSLRDQLKAYSQSAGISNAQSIVKSETDARMELRACQERLEQLEAIIGPHGNPSVKQLTEKLQDKERRLHVLEAQLKTQEASTSMLYAEVDRLSAAWQTLDEQTGNKVFNLVHLEEKVSKLMTEKAKADNRYFAAMRSKEALASENSVLNRLTDKQQRAAEASNETIKQLQGQLSQTEAETGAHQLLIKAHQTRIDELLLEVNRLTLAETASEKRLMELTQQIRDRTFESEDAQAALKRAEEQIIRLEREKDRATRMNGQTNGGAVLTVAESDDLKKYNQDLQKMLKCGSCNQRFKSHVITRCYHTFCKECIDSRLETRQRKCPTCSAPFGQNDFHQIYF